MKYPTVAAFVGHEGATVFLDPDVGREDDDPVVRARPELFTDVVPPGVEPPKEPRRPGRPLGSRNKPKAPAADGD